MNWHEGTATTNNNKTSIAENRRNSRVLKYNNYNYGLFDYSLFIFCFLIDHHTQFCSFKVYRFSLNWIANSKGTEEISFSFFWRKPCSPSLLHAFLSAMFSTTNLNMNRTQIKAGKRNGFHLKWEKKKVRKQVIMAIKITFNWISFLREFIFFQLSFLHFFIVTLAIWRQLVFPSFNPYFNRAFHLLLMVSLK